jgi:sulfatase maturation enzyme AslB (radical SAM superfamily)
MSVNPITFEDYERAHQAKWIVKEIAMKQDEWYEYQIKEAKRKHFSVDLAKWYNKKEAKKASQRRAIGRLITEFDYKIAKCCGMIRNTPNRISASEDDVKRYIIEMWLKELGE